MLKILYRFLLIITSSFGGNTRTCVRAQNEFESHRGAKFYQPSEFVRKTRRADRMVSTNSEKKLRGPIYVTGFPDVRLPIDLIKDLQWIAQLVNRGQSSTRRRRKETIRNRRVLCGNAGTEGETAET